MARRSGKKWYIAGINGTDEDTDIAFTLKRVNPKSKRVLLFSDGKSNRDIKVSHLTLNSKQFSIACRARGGFLMVIE